MDSTELPSSSKRVSDGSEEPAGPMDYATTVPTEKVHHSTNLVSVLGESLSHYGIKRNDPSTNRTGSTMNVKTCNFVCE